MAEWVNHVSLSGRISAEAQDIDLPSGQVLTRMRLVVPRDKPQTKTTVDTIDIVTFKAVIRKKMHGLGVGDAVHVEGAMRRRFWRAGPSVASRVEVEVSVLNRL